MDIGIGQIVFSKCGRDKKMLFIVLKKEGEYLYLADGKLRTLSKLKKKKIKHVQPVNYICENIVNMLENNMYMCDFDIKKAIIDYNVALAS